MRVRIYTDGACSGNPGPGGWAMVFNTDDDCKTHSGHELSTTNNRMELTAVARCLNKISVSNKDDIYEVYSDSAYVINSINNKWLERWKASGWKTKQNEDIKNKDLWKLVDHYLEKIEARGQSLKFIKVKGHAGNTFNELVDKLAREESAEAQTILESRGV